MKEAAELGSCAMMQMKTGSAIQKSTEGYKNTDSMDIAYTYFYVFFKIRKGANNCHSAKCSSAHNANHFLLIILDSGTFLIINI